MGGFARAKIRKGTRLIEYVGRRMSKQESLAECEAGNTFVFTLNDREDLDGSVSWNWARFLNHSCAPNAEAEQDEEDRVFIVAARTIRPGEEITFNYGYDFSEYQDNPCACGAAACVGFITAEEFHAKVRRIVAAEARAKAKAAAERVRLRVAGRRKK